MIRRYGFSAALLVILGAALALRLPNLGNRLFHGDEAVHAFKVQDLRETWVYKYDPNEYHGPTLYYADLPILALSGHKKFGETTEADYRLAPAIVGALMVLLVWLLRDGIGDRAALIAGLLLAISPAFTFYSRYFIQEIVLAFFTLAMIACGWRFHKSGKPWWLVACGASAGAMIATKETAPLAFFAMLVAWLCVRRAPWPVPSDADSGNGIPVLHQRQVPLWGLKGTGLWLFGIGIAVIVAFVFLSGFLTNMSGPVSYFKSYAPWLTRTGSQGIHNHRWSYYLSVLATGPFGRSHMSAEIYLLVFAIPGALAPFISKSSISSPLNRFIAIYTLALTSGYCAISYKTPWCLLSFWTGVIILAAIGVDAWWAASRNAVQKCALAAILVALIGSLSYQSYLACFKNQNDAANPYVYAAPIREVVDLSQKVADIARQSPQKDSTVIKLLSSDEYYWPLPWYLRRFPNVGFYVGMPDDPAAPIVISSSAFDEALTQKFGSNYLMTGYYGLRPGIPMMLWVEKGLWTKYVESLGPHKVQIGE